jgi:hypothetical protein
MESINDRYCRSSHGVTQERPARLALTYEWVEDWHRAIPRRYENYMHWKLEEFVGRCDQEPPQRVCHPRIAVQPTPTGDS